MRNQISDQLDIIVQQRVSTGSPGQPERLGMLLGIREAAHLRLGLRLA
jgi:hypothetical protein